MVLNLIPLLLATLFALSIYIPRVQCATVPSGWKSQDCLADPGPTLLLSKSYNSDKKSTMTWNSCAKLCEKDRYKYFGLKNGYICYCGNSIQKKSSGSGKVLKNDCNVACSGDKKSKCGGKKALQLFLRTSPYKTTTTTKKTTTTAKTTTRPIITTTRSTTRALSTTSRTSSRSSTASSAFTSTTRSTTRSSTSSRTSATSTTTLIPTAPKSLCKNIEISGDAFLGTPNQTDPWTAYSKDSIPSIVALNTSSTPILYDFSKLPQYLTLKLQDGSIILLYENGTSIYYDPGCKSAGTVLDTPKRRVRRTGVKFEEDKKDLVIREPVPTIDAAITATATRIIGPTITVTLEIKDKCGNLLSGRAPILICGFLALDQRVFEPPPGPREIKMPEISPGIYKTTCQLPTAVDHSKEPYCKAIGPKYQETCKHASKIIEAINHFTGQVASIVCELAGFAAARVRPDAYESVKDGCILAMKSVGYICKIDKAVKFVGVCMEPPDYTEVDIFASHFVPGRDWVSAEKVIVWKLWNDEVVPSKDIKIYGVDEGYPTTACPKVDILAFEMPGPLIYQRVSCLLSSYTKVCIIELVSQDYPQEPINAGTFYSEVPDLYNGRHYLLWGMLGYPTAQNGWSGFFNYDLCLGVTFVYNDFLKRDEMICEDTSKFGIFFDKVPKLWKFKEIPNPPVWDA